MENTAVKKNKKGFTLVELVIVIAVLAVLAAIAVPTVTNVINSANVNTDKSNAQTIELALKSAYSEAAAGTWTTNDGVVDPSTLTVDSALQHEGLGDITTLNNNVKEKSSSGTLVFVYDSNGHISCAIPTTGNNPLTSLYNSKAVLVKDAIHA